MSKTVAVACVQHRDGWCACTGTGIRYRDQVKTLCNQYVILPWGLEYRIPDCPECLKLFKHQKRKTDYVITKEEYIQAAINRIKGWCQNTECEIPDVAYVAIYNELKTMFECMPFKTLTEK